MGAKLCRPDSEVWIIWGDGSCGYSVAEIDTMKRFGANVISVVGNDAGWTQILREQLPMFNSSVACKLEVVHISKVKTFFIIALFLIIICINYFLFSSTQIIMKFPRVMEVKACS